MKRTRTRGRGRAASLSLGALLIVATAGGTTAASLAGPLRSPEAVSVPQVTVPAGDYIAQCPATARLVKGADQGTDPAFAPDSDSAKTTVRATVLSDAAERLPGAELEKPDGSTVRTLGERLPEEKAAEVKSASDSGFTGRRAATASGISATGRVSLRVQPLGGQQSTAGAVRSYAAGDGDLAGLAAARCQVPSNQQWLTGASTTVGSMALLTLANPSETPSTVDLELFGVKGRIEAGNTRGIVIAPGTSTDIVLGGLASGEESLSVKATSTGAPVTAIIQQSILRGLTPGGVDFIEPSAAPGEQQVVPGLLVQDAKVQKDVAGQKGYGDAVPTLSLTVPGASDQRVKVRLLGEKGEVPLPRDGQYTVAGRSTLAVPLTGVPAGTYTAVVDAGEPVAASVRSTRGTKAGERTDAAWTGSAQRLGGEHLIPVPQGAASRLVLAAPEGQGSVDVRPVDSKGSVGKPVTVPVASGRTVERTIQSLGKDVVAVALSASGEPVYGGMLSTHGKTDVSSLSVPPATPGPRSVPVDLRY